MVILVNMTKLVNIDEAEEVARIIFSPSMVEGDRVSRNAFLLCVLKSGQKEDYLSVWRTKHRTPTRENVNFSPRNADDEVFGYATLYVEAIHNLEILGCKACVKGKSICINGEFKPCEHHHVGVYYTLSTDPIIGECDDPAFMAFTMELANQAITHKFPD